MSLRVVQFWMSSALLVAMIISAILAAPFMLVGKIMDGLEGSVNAVKYKLPVKLYRSKMGDLNL